MLVFLLIVPSFGALPLKHLFVQWDPDTQFQYPAVTTADRILISFICQVEQIWNILSVSLQDTPFGGDKLDLNFGRRKLMFPAAENLWLISITSRRDTPCYLSVKILDSNDSTGFVDEKNKAKEQ